MFGFSKRPPPSEMGKLVLDALDHHNQWSANWNNLAMHLLHLFSGLDLGIDPWNVHAFLDGQNVFEWQDIEPIVKKGKKLFRELEEKDRRAGIQAAAEIMARKVAKLKEAL